MQLIDSHCHLDFPVFDQDRDEVVNAAQEEQVKQIIVPAIGKKNWSAVRKTAHRYTLVKAAYGLHPMFMADHQLSDIADLRIWLLANKAVAVGECGLDFSIRHSSKEQQIVLFVEQLKLADEMSLPVIIHARKSLDIVLKYLRQHKNIRGVIHSFSGSLQQAHYCINQGFLLGFGGPVTYTRALRLRKLVTELPLHSLLLETDAPDQPDSWHRGERNVPANLPRIATQIAALREIEVSELARVTSQNAQRLFNLPLV